MTENIHDWPVSKLTENFLSKVVAPNFIVREVVKEKQFVGWAIVRTNETEPTLLGRDLYPYAVLEGRYFDKLIVYEPMADNVMEMAQKLWTSIQLKFGIELTTSGFEPIKKDRTE